MAGISTKISSRTLMQSLIKVTELLNETGVEYFLFYGSLLGVVRELQPINGDDDVDFLVPDYCRNELTTALKKNAHIEYKNDVWPNKTKYFSRAILKVDSVDVKIDFYIFTVKNDIIVDRWNFLGDPQLRINHLYIPSRYIYPKRSVFLGRHQVSIPNQSEEVLTYLYGRNWVRKRDKNKDYRMYIIKNKPYIAEGSFRIMLLSKYVKFRRVVYRLSAWVRK